MKVLHLTDKGREWWLKQLIIVNIKKNEYIMHVKNDPLITMGIVPSLQDSTMIRLLSPWSRQIIW